MSKINLPKSKFVRRSCKMIAIILWQLITILDINGYNKRKHEYKVFLHERAKRKLINAIQKLRNTDFMKKS